MKRMLKKCTEEINGIITYLGVPFSGVLYDELGDGKLDPLLIENGKIKERYISPYVDSSKNAIFIDLSELLSDYQEVLREGPSFTGNGYLFMGGFCRRECFIVDSEIIRDVCWTKTGDAISYLRSDSQCSGRFFSESYAWHENVKLRSFRVSTSDSFCGSIVFSESGKLQRITGTDGLLQNIDEIMYSDSAKTIHQLQRFDAQKCDACLTLKGGDVDDGFVEKILQLGMLSETDCLIIENPRITKHGASLIAKQESIKMVVTKDCSEDTIKQFKEVFGERSTIALKSYKEWQAIRC